MRSYSSRPQAQAAAWQQDIRTKLFGLLRLNDLLVEREQIPLAPEVIRTEDRGSHTLREVELNSTAARRFTAVVTLPNEPQGTVPAVVCIHGHGGNRQIVYDAESIYKGFAAALAERGVATIATDVGQHEVYEQNRILMGERLWDLMRCVDYLNSLPAVDPVAIGCAGLSLGGEMAMWLGAMDVRIAATVSSGFLTLMDQMEQNHCMCWKFDGLRDLVDFPDIYSLLAPRPLLCQNGLKEPPTQFNVTLARKAMAMVKVIYGDFGKPGLAVLDVHEGAHETNLPTLLEFFEQHLRSVQAGMALN